MEGGGAGKGKKEWSTIGWRNKGGRDQARIWRHRGGKTESGGETKKKMYGLITIIHGAAK